MRFHVLWVMAGILFLLFIAGLSFVVSAGRNLSKTRRKRLRRPLDDKEQRDWKGAALRLERHIAALKQERLQWQKKTGLLEREMDVYKQKYAEIEEKLERERGWKEKEETEIDKKGRRIKSLEEELQRIEKRSEGEHTELLMLRRENSEFKSAVEAAQDRIEGLESQVGKTQAQSDAYRKEILDLRAENAKLSRRHEDTQWIAKSVHLKVKDELRKTMNELERLKKGPAGT